VTWTGGKTLILTGKVERPAYEVSKAAKSEEEQADQFTGGSHLMIGERRVGPFRRYITFPTDVENVSVTLEAGLLKIRAPKKEFQEGVATKIDVKHE